MTAVNVGTIRDRVIGKMNGTLDVRGNPVRVAGTGQDIKLWAREMYDWSVKVRRDILMLEEYLKERDGAQAAGVFWGDPGAPPPPPE